MKVRALITLLLVCCLGATHASAGARFGERKPLAPEEEREAREFAEALIKRLEEGQDFAPLVGEMFVGDFAERLHASAGSAGSLYFLDRLAAAQANRGEVLRHHIAFNNLVLLTSLYMADAQLSARAARRAAATGETEETKETGDAEVRMSDVFPPEVLELFRADPLLGRFVLEEEAREAARTEAATGDAGAAAREGDAADEEEFITTVEQLRAFTSTVERANELLRQRLTSRQKRRAFEYWRRAAGTDGELMRPYETVTGTDWYGYPAGTRLVCVSLLMFHVELVRVGGAYKVLALYLVDDDD